MTWLFASQEDSEPLMVLLGLAFGGFAWWGGLKSWRGEDLVRHRTTTRRGWTFTGSSRQYQSVGGLGHVGLLGGPGFTLIAAGEGLRDTLGESRDWWLMWVTGVVGMGLVFVSAVYVLVYFWFGVPDRLRPPCQRGWEIVDGEMRLVRPDAFHEHPKRQVPDA